MAGRRQAQQHHSDGELFRLFTENVKDYAIFMLDTGGRVASWNAGAERVLGYRDQDILGRPFPRIFTPEDAADGQPEHELRVAADRGRAEDERWHVRKDGSCIWASGTLTPLWDDAGRLRGFVKILRDITERKRAEDLLTEANQRKDEFLAMLSHELRNPLAPVLHAAGLIEQEAEKPAVKRAAGIIDRQMRHLVRIVDDLLDVSRITRGKVQLCRQRAALHDLVAHAVETTRPLIDSRKHALAV
jgi:PAS domain S-box-containing protein